MNEKIFSNILLQSFYFIGAVFLVGIIIYFLVKAFYTMVRYSKLAIYLSAAIGTPIHELSHALMCILFGHKITEMRLFQIDTDSGMLGYVSHSYNRRNIWALTGNYFIGIAPIVCGSVALFFAMKYLVPTASSEVVAEIDSFAKNIAHNGISVNTLTEVFSMFTVFLGAIFIRAEKDLLWLIFVVIAVCVSLHMNSSGPDIKGALPAIPIVIALLGVVNFAVGYIFPGSYSNFVSAMNMGGGYLASVMLFAVFLAIATVLIAFLIKLIFTLILRILGRR